MEADFDKLEHAKGERVVDCDGNLVGKVTQFAFEPPQVLDPKWWLVVKTSVFGRRRLVPVDSAIDEGGVVRVPYSKDTVRAAPVPLVPTAPAMSECSALEVYYRRAA